MRYIKALGLAMLAAFALSAVAATGASAQESAFFATEGEEVGLETITVSDQVFQPEGTTSFLNCTNADFTSHEHLKAGVGKNPLTVNADYEDPAVSKDCFAETAFGQFNVIVHENGCDFDFYALTHNEAGAGDFEGDAYVDCTTDGATEIEITIPAVGCTYSVPTGTLEPNGNAHPITYTNIEHESVEAVTVDVNGKIPYTHSGGFCTGNSEGEATYTGHAVIGGIDTDTDEPAAVAVTTVE